MLYQRHHRDWKNAGEASTAPQGSTQAATEPRSSSKLVEMSLLTVFLGHRIDTEGIYPLEDKLAAIIQAPATQNVQELCSFIGLINYYGIFIPNAASILAPLNKMLCKDAQWKWSDQCQ